MDENLAIMDEDEVHADRVAAILHAVEAGDTGRLTGLMAPLHAAAVADLLEQMDPHDRRALLALWSGGIDGDVLSELDWSIREEVIDALPDAVVAEAVRDLDTDDVVSGVVNRSLQHVHVKRASVSTGVRDAVIRFDG